MTETPSMSQKPPSSAGEYAYIYRVLRYTPSLVRDEWINIGILIFDPRSGVRRVLHFHAQADETLLRAAR